jgi:hypothetical protein
MKIDQQGNVQKQPALYKLNDNGEFVIDKWVIRAELNADKPALLEAYNNDQQIAFTSGGDELKLDGKEFTGKTGDSSKLVELVNGEYEFSEAEDVIPGAVKEIPAEAGQ